MSPNYCATTGVIKETVIGYCLTEVKYFILQNASSNLLSFLLVLFRSHPAILKIPNELFYDGELQCHADEILRNSYCNWQYLKQRVMIHTYCTLHVETN